MARLMGREIRYNIHSSRKWWPSLNFTMDFHENP